jgi:hypothetical protein
MTCTGLTSTPMGSMRIGMLSPVTKLAHELQ